MNGSLFLSYWGCKMVHSKATHCWFEISTILFLHSQLYSSLWYWGPVISSNFDVFFFLYIWQKGHKHSENKVIFIFDLKLMVWFVNMIAWGVYCLRWKTLSSHKSFNSKRFELFDHSEMPVVFALSEILKTTVFKQSVTRKFPQVKLMPFISLCVQWVIL